MGLRPFLADDLTNLEVADLPDEPGSDDEAEEERREACRGRAERDVAGDVQEPQERCDVGERREQVIEHQPRSFTSRSTTTSQRMPREPFTRITSPGWTAATISGAAASLLVR